MRMGQGVRTGLGHRGITCVLQTQFSSFIKTTYNIQQLHKIIEISASMNGFCLKMH